MSKTIVMSQFMYTDPGCVRARLAIELVRAAREKKCEVFISDGTGGAFRDELLRLGANVSNQIPGMGPDRRRLMGLVYTHMNRGDAALWTEEKPSLMLDLERIVEPIKRGEANLVIPARTEEAWLSHPPEQMFIEKFGNEAFHAFTGIAIDCWFGPFAADLPSLARFLRPEDGIDDKWMSIHGPRVDVIAQKLRIRSVEVPNYRYDERQRAEEKANPALILKRAEQVATLVPALYARAKALGLTK